MGTAPASPPNWTPPAAANGNSRRRGRRPPRPWRTRSPSCTPPWGPSVIRGKARRVGRVTLEINGRPYVVGCEDGGEPHVRALGARIDEKVRQISPDAGAPGEARLILMAALMIADQLNEAEAAIQAADARGGEFEKMLDRLAS